MLGVDKAVGKYRGCTESVGEAFGQNMDMAHSSKLYVANLLERGVRILVYVGEPPFSLVDTEHTC
jgi:carboxypeptidase C (cathepsin A)